MNMTLEGVSLTNSITPAWVSPSAAARTPVAASEAAPAAAANRSAPLRILRCAADRIEGEAEGHRARQCCRGLARANPERVAVDARVAFDMALQPLALKREVQRLRLARTLEGERAAGTVAVGAGAADRGRAP